MTDFIELTGKSGATYRFRSWAVGENHPPIAGNYVAARRATAGVLVLRIGTAADLSRVGSADLPRGVRLFTRFEVARAHRQAAHSDLAAAWPGAEQAADPT